MHHVRKQYHRWSFRLSVFGKYVDAGESYADEISAGVAADLAKHYLASEFKLVLPPSLSGDMFSSLAYSRRHVDLSSSYSVEKALAPGVKNFINENAAELLAHKASQPPETTASKFRRSEMVKSPTVNEWVNQLELAEMDAREFSAFNNEYFFRLIDSLPARLDDFMKPLRLALKMHANVTNSKLSGRALKLAALKVHAEQDFEYLIALAAELRAEQETVFSAVATLEASRPNLS